MTRKIAVRKINRNLSEALRNDVFIWNGEVEKFLDAIPEEPLFDLVVTSPPYNIGKEYENASELNVYLNWQREVLAAVVPRVKPTGSICWQVGNYVENGSITPLDIRLDPIFQELDVQLRNRIIWCFGHGLHSQRRFSGRYEVILWYTKSDDYQFNLDSVRIDSKYPSKKHYKGPKKGQYSSNPLGKNPEDVWNFPEPVWELPNVKANHKEKMDHPCQFPVGLVERLVLALTKPGDLVFDPFGGVFSAGVASLLHNRRFWTCEVRDDYCDLGRERLQQTIDGTVKYRPHDLPIYDHRTSPLSQKPEIAPETNDDSVTTAGSSVKRNNM